MSHTKKHLLNSAEDHDSTGLTELQLLHISNGILTASGKTAANITALEADSHTHSNKAALDLVSGTNTGDQIASTVPRGASNVDADLTAIETQIGNLDYVMLNPASSADNTIASASQSTYLLSLKSEVAWGFKHDVFRVQRLLDGGMTWNYAMKIDNDGDILTHGTIDIDTSIARDNESLFRVRRDGNTGLEVDKDFNILTDNEVISKHGVAVGSNDINKIVKLTQAAYDLIVTPDPETLYVIVD